MKERMKHIKNIIFDVGEVLLSYRWKDMLLDHGLSLERAEQVGEIMFEDQLWKKLDMGEYLVEEVIAAYETKYPAYGADIRWFITHGEQMHVPREKIWKQLGQLKEKGYNIYLLSNYSEQLFQKHTKGADFLQVIDGKVVSYEVHKIKPDPGIYQCLLDRYHLKPEECLFFDDRRENVEAGRRMGISGIQVKSEEQLYAILAEIIE